MDQNDLDFGPDVPGASTWRTRDFLGFQQSQEAPGEPWRFNVCGFDSTCTGQHGRCTVLRSDGTAAWVPIDAQDRITVAGRKYGRRYWQH